MLMLSSVGCLTISPAQLANMIFSKLLVLSTLALAVSHGHHHHGHDHNHGPKERCSAVSPSREVMDKMNEEIQQLKRTRASPILCTGCIDIQVHNWIFVNQKTTEMSQRRLDLQMDVLDEHFQDTPFRFTVAQTRFIDTGRYTSPDVEDNIDVAEEVGNAHRVGGWDTLNVYYADGWGNFATFPSTNGDENLPTDGAWVNTYTLPGLDEFNLGNTLTHEVGHWLGLEHTFWGSDEPGLDPCSPNHKGDFVDDTPQQSGPTSGCPVGRDSCLNLPGIDPINNFMDYSDDECVTEFTKGQVERMFYVWSIYRQKGESCPSGHSIFKVEYSTGDSPINNGWSLFSDDEAFGWCTDADSCSSSPCLEFQEPNAEFVSDFCIPNGKAYTFSVTDKAAQGFTDGGFLMISLNDIAIHTFPTNFGASATFAFDSSGSTGVVPTPPAPPPAPSPNDFTTFTFVIRFDWWPQEMDIMLSSADGAKTILDYPFDRFGEDFEHVTYIETFQLKEGQSYRLRVRDSFEDGMEPPAYFALYYGTEQTRDMEIYKQAAFDSDVDVKVFTADKPSNPAPLVDSTDECGNDADWTFETRRGVERNCDWIALRADRRCRKIGIDGTPAFDACQLACGAC